MDDRYALEEIAMEVKAIKRSAQRLKKISGGIQAVDKNADRILSSVKMLEINLGG
jgi:hypothetical protein